MAEEIRFHIDESADPDIALALRRAGIDVTTTQEAGLRTAKDSQQWAFVKTERRVIVTHDPDFLRLASRDSDHAGVAYCQQGSQTIGEIIEMLILVHGAMTAEEVAGRVQFL
jgi:predicted nuclease of predicted toxin-antitoxin system